MLPTVTRTWKFCKTIFYTQFVREFINKPQTKWLPVRFLWFFIFGRGFGKRLSVYTQGCEVCVDDRIQKLSIDGDKEELRGALTDSNASKVEMDSKWISGRRQNVAQPFTSRLSHLNMEWKDITRIYKSVFAWRVSTNDEFSPVRCHDCCGAHAYQNSLMGLSTIKCIN